MLIGGVTNSFESIVRQKLNGEDINWWTVAQDAGIGVVTAGMFHGLGKGLKDASKYVKNAINKVLSKNESALMNIARKIDDLLSPVVLVETSTGQKLLMKADGKTAVQDKISKIVGDANDSIKNAAKGVSKANERLSSLTKEQLKGKPKNSPNPDKWFKKNGNISIDDEGVWTYHDWEGNSVSYPDGYPDFKSAGMVKQEVNIGPFEGYNKDFPRADELAPNGAISENSTWHHHQDGITLQEVLTKLHERYRHRGGMSKIKK